ncbi:MAG: NAD(P) transhydrogenase subunit alpha [Lentisphaerae bacterium]|nr:NAD(P) transhydrogenase subunit alpha [Lentisphaerota bacterium]
MRLMAPRESWPGEQRVALIPEAVRKLTALGMAVDVQCGLGASIHVPDEAYRAAGATLCPDPHAALGAADVVVRLRPPSETEAAELKSGALHISHLDPFSRRPLIEALARQGVSAISMELIPRTTIAQKMDALSSQASLGGYVAVILAAERIAKILPMMMTPAGTITPARVFIIGAGVAGLQAIATAKRLGARVEAFDTRPVVKEQVQSLGAKFVEVDLGETGQTKDGYARALTEEQLARQREAMARHCAEADIVITTAQVFGRPAPRILTEAMVRAMRPGSVVVDMAVETGGNVEGSQLDAESDLGGVRVVGLGNLPGRVAVPASQMYASNLASLIEHIWDPKARTLRLNAEDDIVKGCLVTHRGDVVNAAVRKAWGR